MSHRKSAEVVVIIVGFRNADDVASCLRALSNAAITPNFDVFICENGGLGSYEELVHRLTCEPCYLQSIALAESPSGMTQFLATRSMTFLSRPSKVLIGCASENLGYAGGINAWLRELARIEGWKGIWILNPDTEPHPDALAALVSRAEFANKGMVGSTILEAGSTDVIRFRGGLHWQRFGTRGISIGLNERVGDPFDLSAVEDAMDCASGASMYVTRKCFERIGLMDERYFLFDEDLDWGVRTKKLGLGVGYASASIVAHRGGTTTGSGGGKAMSRLAVYLQHRNAIHIVRRYFPWSLPVRVAVSIMYALRFLAHRAPENFFAVLEGVMAGLAGETGQPGWYRKRL